MAFTILTVDLIVKFRLAAIEHTSHHPQMWQLEVRTIEDVANVLLSLGFIDCKAAKNLAEQSTTVTPRCGFTTIPLAELADLTALTSPENEPPSSEAQDAYMLVVHGETTEEYLANASFLVSVNGTLQ